MEQRQGLGIRCLASAAEPGLYVLLIGSLWQRQARKSRDLVAEDIIISRKGDVEQEMMRDVCSM